MITIIIPAYNEEKRLERTVRSFSRRFPNHTLFIIPNGCTDKTEIIAQMLSKKLPNVKVHSLRQAGKGIAVYEGIRRTTTDHVGFVDADMAIPPEEFEKLIKHTKTNQCVIATRYKTGAKMVHKEPLATRIASRTFNLLFVRLLLRLPLSDTQCGAKIFETKLAKKIISSCSIKDMTFDPEMLYLIRKKNVAIKEVPIHWYHEKSGSKTRLVRNSFRMLRTVFHILFKHG